MPDPHYHPSDMLETTEGTVPLTSDYERAIANAAAQPYIEALRELAEAIGDVEILRPLARDAHIGHRLSAALGAARQLLDGEGGA